MVVSTAGHGVNMGYGYGKYVLIDSSGNERSVVFPALVSPAGAAVAGSLQRIEAVEVDGARYWVGEDALLGSPRSLIAQDRLHDPVFLPALLRSALSRLGSLNGSAGGACVTGLPAAWAADRTKAQALGARMRAAYSVYSDIRVIPESLAPIYDRTLNNNGEIVGDPALLSSRVAIVDLGHYTDDTVEVNHLRPVPTSLATYQLGTARPLQQLRVRLSAYYERELTLYEVDQAVRAGGLLMFGQLEPLPAGWEHPIRQNGEELASRLVEQWGRGGQFSAILLAGGGAELAPKIEPILERFPHAVVLPDAQLSIARGYARLARREALAQAQR